MKLLTLFLTWNVNVSPGDNMREDLEDSEAP